MVEDITYRKDSYKIQSIHIKGIYALQISIYIKGYFPMPFHIYVQ